MKRFLQLLVIGGFCMAPVSQQLCYAQEKEITVVVTPQASRMLSPGMIQAQKELELAEVRGINTANRADYYETLPNRSLETVQNRFMTYETQKACRAVERDYTIDLRFTSEAVAIAYWDFGDEKPRTFVAVPPRAGSLTTGYTYAAPGVYTIQVEFFDSSYRPTSDPVKKIKVIVEACLPPAAPELPVNPNIHKVTIQ